LAEEAYLYTIYLLIKMLILNTKKVHCLFKLLLKSKTKMNLMNKKENTFSASVYYRNEHTVYINGHNI